jgi:hypothetical protein
LFDQRTFKEQGHFTQMPADLAERERLLRASFGHLVERVVDDHVRAALKRVSQVDIRLGISSSLEALESAMKQFSEAVQSASEVVGLPRQHLHCLELRAT